MEELIFFAVIIFFSVIESIARSRRQKKGGTLPEGTSPEVPDSDDWDVVRPGAKLPTYGADPSYDEGVVGDRGDRGSPYARPAPSRQAPTRSGGATRPSDRPSSEELLPGDLLEELAKLAGRAQERTAQTLDLPKESPPLPVPVPTPQRPAQAGRREPPARKPRTKPPRTGTHGEHRVHAAHAGYGTDPSSRAKSLEDDLDPLAEYLGKDALAVREQLRSKDVSALRRAFVLGEVLGPPVGLRE